jgi:hypothetical protein
MATVEYHIKQAEIAARLALVETDPAKAANLRLLALRHYARAGKAGMDDSAAPPTDPRFVSG